MDLFGTKGDKNANVEVIHTGTSANSLEAASAVSPVKISEVGEGKYQIERPGEEEPETYDGQTGKASFNEKEMVASPPQSEHQPLSAEDIARADDDELVQEAQAKIDTLKQQLTPVSPEIQGAMYLDEFKEDFKEALLAARRADQQAELLSD
uniref:Uncharacterized protein n=1 Tax=Prevotella sp. GTC17254 TaxID=3236794 RepID=A0AB33IWY1_9BACT